MTSDLHLEARDVACSIGRRQIVAGVDLQVERGTMVALVGPNGSGKSTLLRALSGASRPSAGTVLVDGTSIQSMSGRDRARAIAIVGQHESPSADLLVGEVVALGRLPHRPPWAGVDEAERRLVVDALERVGLGGLVDHPADRLSGGEQRRVLIARALAQDSPIMMLDEPTNHLDVRHQHDLLSRVRGLGRTVVVALHDLDLAATYFDRVAVLDRGRLLAYGHPDDVLDEDLIREAFGVEAVRVVHPRTGRAHLLLTGPPD